MLTVVAVCALILAGLGLLSGVLALRTLGRIRRGVGLLGRGGGDRESFLEASARHIELTEQTRQEFAQLQARFQADLESMQAEIKRGVAGARLDLGVGLSVERDDLAAQIAAVRARLDAELTSLRENIDAADDTFHQQIRSERAALAADNSAARDQVRGAVERVEKSLSTSLRRVALVRFDGFDDLSGRLSFCLVLLDGRGDGIALTSLTGRADTRLYAKPITAGSAATELSPEERQAVKAAMSG